MGMVLTLPRMFKPKHREAVATDDPRIGAVIIIQQTLSGMSDEEAAFVIQTVQANMDLNRRHRKAWEFDE
jgi:hypothetical protein